VATDEAKRAHTDRLIADAAPQPPDGREAGLPRPGAEDLPLDLRPLRARVHPAEPAASSPSITVTTTTTTIPSDGSNWELLCLYCHDNEHARQLDAEAARQSGLQSLGAKARGSATAQPFANLKDLLKRS
jgi:hypothetical protein